MARSPYKLYILTFIQNNNFFSLLFQAKTHLVQFYKVLHSGLTDPSRMDEMYTLIRFTGSRFFSLMLPGYTAYILDFLYAANSIISNSDLKGR